MNDILVIGRVTQMIWILISLMMRLIVKTVK
ncbi:unnamed protein product [Trichobilharzia regenti]|nr:unnamed protein product [Trichobilharzia regenti]